MNDVYDNVLSKKTESILSSYFIMKTDLKNNKKELDELFLNVFYDANASIESFYSFVDLSSEYIKNEVSIRVHIIFSNIRKILSFVNTERINYIIELDKKKSNPNYKVSERFRIYESTLKNHKIRLKGEITNLITGSSIDIDNETKKSIVDVIMLSLSSKTEYIESNAPLYPPVFNLIFESILNKYMNSYNDYVIGFLVGVKFDSGDRLNPDFLNKKPDGSKYKRGPIKRNVETEKLVSDITSATVEKYPNVSDHKLSQAIQEYLSSKNIDNSYNTIKKWVKEHREQEGTTCNGEESYKGVISLVIP
ncbi:hypothetical protein NZT28_003313 [Salmonella enterica]|nr:hypothetical protein [Salmonella enterica]